MSIKAVVFDYGGVICNFPPPKTEAEAELERLTGLPIQTLQELDRKHRGEWDRGTYNGKTYYQFILSGAGIFLDDTRLAEIACADQNRWKQINSATVALMREIKAAGFTMGILSNMPHDFLVWARKNIAIFNEADPALFSCDFNLIKPEKAIYEILRDRCGCKFSEIVFFDDTAENIHVAKEMGIQAIIWESAQAAREVLKKIDPVFGVL